MRTLVEAGVTTAESFTRAYSHAAQEINDRGCCSSFGEWNPVIHAVATWIHAPDGEMYSISCGGPGYLLPPEFLLSNALQEMRRAIEQMSKETGIRSAFDHVASARKRT